RSDFCRSSRTKSASSPSRGSLFGSPWFILGCFLTPLTRAGWWDGHLCRVDGGLRGALVRRSRFRSLTRSSYPTARGVSSTWRKTVTFHWRPRAARCTTGMEVALSHARRSRRIRPLGKRTHVRILAIHRPRLVLRDPHVRDVAGGTHLRALASLAEHERHHEHERVPADLPGEARQGRRRGRPALLPHPHRR